VNPRPSFVSLERVIDLHAQQLELFGGQAGVREMSLLESAVGMPATAFGGELVHGDLAEMAAAYLFYINKNHPFIDGNKRTAAAAAVIFLKYNDVDFNAPADDFTAITLAVASGTADKASATAFFRKHWPAG
jgi:death-on-curing protein